jgi:cell division protein FtsZ
MMGTGMGRGESALVDAAKLAITSPLMEDTPIAGARGILINITGSSSSLGLHEVHEACSIIREAAECDEAQINFGVIQNETMGDAVKITVIATGFQPEHMPVAERRGSVVPVIRVQPEPTRMRAPEPEPVFVPEPVAMPEPEPEAVMVAAAAAAAAEPEPMLDLDDLDTPAYLRQGRLLN